MFITQYETMKAVWNDKILAESDKTIIVEGNQYFPPESIKVKFFKKTNTKTTCSWKGIASYYSIVVNDKTNEDSAWYYPEPTESAKKIKNYIAFWKGVKIIR